ncbi:MAG TPA: WD40 repeat domain-containing protein [Dehalococcoidia bacterium]|nr:WD40 repeat domain-containing protein [Dehalococcoidia bacterium]
MTTNVYVYDGRDVRAVAAPGGRPLRWAAWRPDGAHALIVGNRGTVLRCDGVRFETLADAGTHNLRGAGWSPDGALALLVGNRGAVLVFDGARFAELAPVTTENLRRVAWSPDGSCALIVGNGGCVLRYDRAARTLLPVPGDRAHTLRCIAWRPDGAYALIGAYASRYAGYPRPHMLYRCDGRYAQGILATDDEDDALAIDWQPGAAAHATVLVASYGAGGGVANKTLEYMGWGVRHRALDAPATMLGAAWHPDGSHLLLCGEGGVLLRAEGATVAPVASGTRDNLVGPFWRPGAAEPLALLLRGPDEKVYTI